jgi:hypothetical protein
VNELSADLALPSVSVDHTFYLLCCGVHFVSSYLAKFCSTSVEMKLSGGKTESITVTDKISYIACATEPYQFSRLTQVSQIMVI